MAVVVVIVRFNETSKNKEKNYLKASGE